MVLCKFIPAEVKHARFSMYNKVGIVTANVQNGKKKKKTHFFPVLKFTVHERKLYEEKNSLMRVIFRLSFSVLQKSIQHANLTNWSI